MPGDIRRQERLLTSNLQSAFRRGRLPAVVLILLVIGAAIGWHYYHPSEVKKAQAGPPPVPVTYTAVGAMVRDYTVVIPVDTTSAGSDYETTIGFYNVLNSGNANLANQPLKPKATTLSRTDLITFQ